MGNQETIAAYKDMLKELEAPDKAKINALTMVAEDKALAPAVVQLVEEHLRQCKPSARLPVLYLMDSIIKNVQEPYTSLFSRRIDMVFGRVWDSTLPANRAPLTKLVNTWEPFLDAHVLERVKERMKDRTQAAAGPPPPTLKQQQQPTSAGGSIQLHPAQQQQQLQALPIQQLPAAPNIILQQPGQQLMHAGIHVVQLQAPPPPPAQSVFVMGPNGQLLPVVQPPAVMHMQPAPLSAIPPHLVGGLPPVSPAHPTWQQQQPQPMQQLRPMQQQQLLAAAGLARRSPAYAQASPLNSTGRSPHHRPGTSPQHGSQPSSGHRSTSPAASAEHIAASLNSLLQGLTKSGYLNDPALKTTSFDPAFIKKEHKGVVELLKAASEGTRARFKDLQFQRNKRRKDAQARQALVSRSWYVPVSSWIAGTTLVDRPDGTAVEEDEAEEEGPAPVPTVEADASQPNCAISHEPFESFFDQDRDTWLYRGAVRLHGPEAQQYGVLDGSIVKVECLAQADTGSSPAALAAAAVAGGPGQAEVEADMVAAAAAALPAGQQQQQQQKPAATGGEAQQQQQQQQQHALAQVKAEPQGDKAAPAGATGEAMKLEPAAAAAIKAKQDLSPTADQQQQQQEAAAGGLKREAAEALQLQQQEGTPSKKQRVSPEP